MGCLYTREEGGLNMFKKLFLSLFAAACFTPFMYADVQGSIGASSDYFWRGASQNDGNPAIDLSLEWQGDGFYVGSWASEVDFGDEVQYEYDFYAGYALLISDRMAIDVGLIQYNYDEIIESTEEIYAGLSLGQVSLYHYVNLDNSDLSYSEVEYTFPFVTQLDVSVLYGLHSSEGSVAMGLGDDDYFGMKLKKDLGDFTISAMVMDDARHGDIMDNASVSLHYNF